MVGDGGGTQAEAGSRMLEVGPATSSAPAGTPKVDKLNVFISYSRADLAFADELFAGLELAGFDPKLDRHAIVEGEDWKKRLGGLITDADTVVFVISPDSARSDICRWEIDESVRLSKRILPALWRPAGAVPVPEKLAALNYVRFDEGRSFMAGLKALSNVLNTDLEWLREHARLLAGAVEWDTGGRPPNRLLSGRDIGAAKDWIARRPRNAPEPTALHLDFVKESESWEAEQQGERQRQLEERERLVRQAEVDRTARETAQAEALAQARRVTRRTLAGLAVAIVLALIAAVASGIAWQQQQEAANRATEARSQATRAERSEASAVILRQQTQFTESGLLAIAASQLVDDTHRDAGTAMLLALDGLPDKAGGINRPHVPEAEVQLYRALGASHERGVLAGHGGIVFSAAWSPDGSRILTASQDKTARVWEAVTGKESARL